MLSAATEKGLCRISFDEDESDLRRRFPKADIRAGDASLATLAARVVTLAHQPGRTEDLPIDVQVTAFQQAVWEALRAIPPGETRSYAQIAAAMGKPGGIRAAVSACRTHLIAIFIPCTRVVRIDG